jgi:hypothetical protein
MKDNFLINLSNAFLILKIGKYKIALDPWIKSGIYDGGWSLFPETSIDEDILKDVTHLYISHLHEDHCDPSALKLLCKNVEAFIPNVFGFQVLKKKLETAGINNIKLLNTGVPENIFEDCVFEVIKPMNGFGQELDLYKSNSAEDSVAIDTGLLIQTNNLKLTFLADNTPYDFSGMDETLGRINASDLLAFPYNGAASDYPICYKNISDIQMLDIANKRELRRKEALKNFFNIVKPKMIMPYSSDFAVIGPAAKRFGKFSDLWWADKEKVASIYQKETGISSISLSQNDRLEFTQKSYGICEMNLIKGQKNNQSLKSASDVLYSTIKNVDSLYQYSGSDLNKLTIEASEHMFNFMRKLKSANNWIFEVALLNRKTSFYLDMYSMKNVNSFNKNRNHLKVMLNDGYYEALLLGKAHWNNAQLSFQLEWERTPNIYNHSLYTALNFFHVSKRPDLKQ